MRKGDLAVVENQIDGALVNKRGAITLQKTLNKRNQIEIVMFIDGDTIKVDDKISGRS